MGGTGSADIGVIRPIRTPFGLVATAGMMLTAGTIVAVTGDEFFIPLGELVENLKLLSAGFSVVRSSSFSSSQYRITNALFSVRGVLL